jgi:hypothetical protein
VQSAVFFGGDEPSDYLAEKQSPMMNATNRIARKKRSNWKGRKFNVNPKIIC